jgi:hypothetical protein
MTSDPENVLPQSLQRTNKPHFIFDAHARTQARAHTHTHTKLILTSAEYILAVHVVFSTPHSAVLTINVSTQVETSLTHSK